MGKIRVKTLGDDQAEREQEEKSRKRIEAKRAKKDDVERSEIPQSGTKEAETPEEKKVVQVEAKTDEKDTAPQEDQPKQTKSKYAEKKGQKHAHSQKYLAVVTKVDKKKVYSLKDALTLLPDLHIAKFDETVELHINTSEAGVSGSVTLPHGTGKQMRIAIANQTEDAKGVEDLVKTIESGKIEFDILIATPDAMPKLARVAKFLGPRGLMPNPKNGTVTPKPDDVAKKYEGGQINFKTEAKAPIVHIAVGRMSFGEEKLMDNIQAVFKAIDTTKTRNATLKSTMSPGIKIAVS